MTLNASMRSAAAELGRWFDRNRSRLGYGSVGLLVGLLLGWWAGSYLACSRTDAGCEVRADSISAAGTWFGAIGTVAAVLAAVAALRSEERIRRQDARRAAASASAIERRYQQEAELVTVTCDANHSQGDRILGYAVSVRNGTDRAEVFELRGKDPDGSFNSEHTLLPGRSSSTQHRVGQWTQPAHAATLSKREFEYWCEERTSITFRMNDRLWRRDGLREVELIEPEDALP